MGPGDSLCCTKDALRSWCFPVTQVVVGARGLVVLSNSDPPGCLQQPFLLRPGPFHLHPSSSLHQAFCGADLYKVPIIQSWHSRTTFGQNALQNGKALTHQAARSRWVCKTTLDHYMTPVLRMAKQLGCRCHLQHETWPCARAFCNKHVMPNSDLMAIMMYESHCLCTLSCSKPSRCLQQTCIVRPAPALGLVPAIH